MSLLNQITAVDIQKNNEKCFANQVCDSDDEKSFDQSCLSHNPGEPEVEHDPPDVEQTFHKNALKPSQFPRFFGLKLTS